MTARVAAVRGGPPEPRPACEGGEEGEEGEGGEEEGEGGAPASPGTSQVHADAGELDVTVESVQRRIKALRAASSPKAAPAAAPQPEPEPEPEPELEAAGVVPPESAEAAAAPGEGPSDSADWRAKYEALAVQLPTMVSVQDAMQAVAEAEGAFVRW